MSSYQTDGEQSWCSVSVGQVDGGQSSCCDRCPEYTVQTASGLVTHQQRRGDGVSVDESCVGALWNKTATGSYHTQTQTPYWQHDELAISSSCLQCICWNRGNYAKITFIVKASLKMGWFFSSVAFRSVFLSGFIDIYLWRTSVIHLFSDSTGHIKYKNICTCLCVHFWLSYDGQSGLIVCPSMLSPLCA